VIECRGASVGEHHESERESGNEREKESECLWSVELHR
jgi:hypothetical protein